jgi:hypothetical protein
LDIDGENITVDAEETDARKKKVTAVVGELFD